MRSPLAGSLARQVHAAMRTLFLPATLTRDGTDHPCRALYETHARGYGPGGEARAAHATLLVLARSLDLRPEPGDRLRVRGSAIPGGSDAPETFVVLALDPGKAAVTIDPAGAVWRLEGVRAPIAGARASVDAALAATLGLDYDWIRPGDRTAPLGPAGRLGVRRVLFTPARTAAFTLTSGARDADALWHALLDATGLVPGDYLAPAGGATPRDPAYFVVSTEPHLPPVAALCNAHVDHERPNSQLSAEGGQGTGLPSQEGGAGRYWGLADTEGPTGPGEARLASDAPVALLPLGGRTMGPGLLPGEAAGPNRVMFLLPVSVFPFASLRSGDVLTDRAGDRYQVSAPTWTPFGYRADATRLEN